MCSLPNYSSSIPNSPIHHKQHHSAFPSGAIVGIIVGVVVLIILIVLFLTGCSWIHQCCCFTESNDRISQRRNEVRPICRQANGASTTATATVSVGRYISKSNAQVLQAFVPATF